MRRAAQPTAAEAGRILKLAWPVMLTSLNWTLLHLIDVAVVGLYGTAELGSLAAARTLTYITIVTGLCGMSGVLIFAARADGAAGLRRTGDHFRQGIVLGAMIGLACMVALLLLAEPLLRLAGVPGSLAAGGAVVVRVMALCYPAQFVQVGASFFLEGISRPRRVMVVNLVQLPINAVLAWAWVGGHLGLPAWGAAGAAAATSTVCCAGAVAMVATAWRLPQAAERNVRDLSAAAWSRALAGLPPLVRFGLVPAIAAGLELGGFSWLIVLSTQLGAVPAAAFQTVFSLHNFGFALAMGFGSAAGVRAGNAVGAGEPRMAVPRSMIAATLSATTMIAVGLVYFLAPATVIRPFSTDPAVRTLGTAMLTGLAPFMFLDGVQMVFASALRALGDQVAAGVVGIIAFFLVTGGAGWLLVRGGAGPMGLIYAAAAGMAVAAILQAGRMAVISSRLRSRSSG